jgi:ribonuclease VapC
MIVLDTSAVMALLLNEADANRIADALLSTERLVMSAGTLAECRIVAAHRGFSGELAALVKGLGVEIDPVDQAMAVEVADAYAKWGKGTHPAGLNFGDCFAYACARRSGAPLLFVGSDFSKTDIAVVMAR